MRLAAGEQPALRIQANRFEPRADDKSASGSSSLMPARDVHIRQQVGEIGLPGCSGFGKSRLHLAPDRFPRQAEFRGEIIDCSARQESVYGANFRR